MNVKVNGVPGLEALKDEGVCEFGMRKAEFGNRLRTLEDDRIKKFGIGLRDQRIQDLSGLKGHAFRDFLVPFFFAGGLADPAGFLPVGIP